MISCPFCSSAISDDHAAFCPDCGRQITAATVPPVMQPGQTSGKAIASLISGLAFFFLIPAVAAIVLGHLAKRDIHRSGGRLKGSGLATAGLALGYSGAVAIPIVLIIAAIALPNLMRSRMLADESSAIGSLRTIYAASTAYAATYGNGFPPSLAALGPAPTGGNSASCDHADMIEHVLADGRKDGYVFRYVGENPLPSVAPGCSHPGFSGFTIDADPVTRGTTGRRSFFMGPSGVIRYNNTQSATASDPPVGG